MLFILHLSPSLTPWFKSSKCQCCFLQLQSVYKCLLLKFSQRHVALMLFRSHLLCLALTSFRFDSCFCLGFACNEGYSLELRNLDGNARYSQGSIHQCLLVLNLECNYRIEMVYPTQQEDSQVWEMFYSVWVFCSKLPISSQTSTFLTYSSNMNIHPVNLILAYLLVYCSINMICANDIINIIIILHSYALTPK